jgi:hypothetical protein
LLYATNSATSKLKTPTIVGSTAVTNKFKSDAYAAKFNDMFKKSKVLKTTIKGMAEHLPRMNKFTFMLHESKDILRFLHLLSTDNDINDNDTIVLVGHGDWIKEYVLEPIIERENNLSSRTRLFNDDKYYKQHRKVQNLSAYVMQYTLPIQQKASSYNTKLSEMQSVVNSAELLKAIPCSWPILDLPDLLETYPLKNTDSVLRWTRAKKEHVELLNP